MNDRTNARQDILKRLSQSVPWKKQKSPPPLPLPLMGVTDRSVLIETFTTKATAAGAVIRRVSGYENAAAEVISFIKELNFTTVIVSDEEIVKRTRMAQTLSDAGMNVVSLSPDPARYKEACFSANVGITGSFAGIAETGTLAILFSRENPRLVSHAPFCHVALLGSVDILPDTESFWKRIGTQSSIPTAMALVTGPSMTADIALTAVRGIHGPGKLLIVLMD